ncbi:MAG: HD domain-containing protein [Candidatus Yonathbacteria bacterium]|nr:HD domain-containing protein [Candidatus Yonathbacteria bacterium]NTW47689.1 HD domain-containing protein [Candidatus Yonathbacteria bacterium]
MDNHKEKTELENVADFLFEVGILAKTPRSGFFFLGSGEQSVAEHINRTCYIGYCLAEMAGDVDTGKVVQLCLFHDISESRISDLNYVHQKYTERFEHRAHEDLTASLPFGDKMKALIDEYEERESKEARLAKDADNIEFILSLKEQLDIGNERANTWLPATVKRLKTEEGKNLAERVLTIDSDAWWYGDKEDEWWVSRNNNK